MTENIVIETDRVIFRDEAANCVLWGDFYDLTPEERAVFEENFEHVTTFALGDPDEDWYQGVSATAVIRRKSDGKLFGYPYWTSISKHGEPYIQDNGEHHGFEDSEAAVYVWLPVEPFTITGYKVTEAGS